MSTSPKTRSSKFSSIQKEAMVDFMELNPLLRRGKYNKEFTPKVGEKLWQELADLLNTLPGCEKDTNQWRKSWQDLKQTVESKCSENNKNSNQTGGGRATGVPLSLLEERVKCLIGDTTIRGNPEIPESVVNMNWQLSPMSTSAVKRINDQIKQNDAKRHRSERNHDPQTTTITAPSSTTNIAPPSTPNTSSPVLIRSTASNVNSPSPNHQQQGTSPIRSSSPTSQAHSSINYLRNILSVTEQISPIRQMNVSQVSSASNTPIVNASHSSQTNRQRLSTSLDLSQRRSLSSPYSRQHQPLASQASPNSNLNRSVSSSQRPSRVNTKQRKPRRIATQRLENTIEATDKLIEVIQRKTQMKENYYQYKLELMDANVKAQEGIAAALADIVTVMKQN